MSYVPDPGRYSHLDYRRCGRSGLLLPPVSLGLWHNFGAADDFENARQLIHGAFDAGITYFDLANNYGPPPGAAEECFGRIFMQDLSRFRDELVIATKAGHLMWAGPYGDWGSRKHMLSSLDQSLSRMKLDYVDIFYAHRHDPETPLEETAGALVTAVRSGKALYAGISKFPAEQTRQICAMLREAGVPCLVHQLRYNMFNREPEESVFQAIRETGTGCVAFSPLAQGMLLAGGNSSGFPCGRFLRLLNGRTGPGAWGENSQPGCPGPEPRPEPRPDGAGLGVERPRGDHGPDRRQPPPASHGLPESPGKYAVHRGGAFHH